MGVKQRLVIGNIVIESRELSWETIKEIAKEIKKVARWNAEHKEWRANWRIIAKVNDFLRFINQKLMYVDQAYAYRILDIIDKLIANIPHHIVDPDANKAYICVIGEDPYELIKKVSRDILPLRIEIRNFDIPEVGTIEIPFLVANLTDIASLASTDKIKLLPKPIMGTLLKLSKKARLRKLVAKLTERNRIHIRLPADVYEELISELVETGKIKYYYETPEGLLEEKIIDTCRVYRKTSTIDVYMAPFTVIYLEEIANKFGLELEINIGLPDREIRGLKEKYELYPHQLASLMNWIDNKFRGTVVIPTGGGKTLVGIAAMVRIKKPTIVFVPNLWLLDQWREKISQFTGIPKSAIGVLGKGDIDIRDITIATYQSGVRHMDKIQRRFWLAIFDECHHIPARTFRKIAMNLCSPYRLALSATPSRRDRNEELIFKLAGKIVYSITYHELVKKGLLAPMIFRRIYVPLPPEIIAEYYQLRHLVDKEHDPIKKRQLLNKLIALAQENPNKIDVIKEIVKKFSSERIFIFTTSIKYAKRIASEINKIVPTAALTAEESKREEENIIKRFKMGIISVLVIIKKAEEGVDIGEASIAIITGGSKQKREFIQRVGRVLRPHRGKLARVYEIISEGTVEEYMARKRGSLDLVRYIGDYVKKNFGTDVFREIRWNPYTEIDLA